MLKARPRAPPLRSEAVARKGSWGIAPRGKSRKASGIFLTLGANADIPSHWQKIEITLIQNELQIQYRRSPLHARVMLTSYIQKT